MGFYPSCGRKARQLAARVQAVLRRAGKRATPAGQLMLDPSRREMRLGQDEAISLTPLENQLLEYLMLNAGHVLTTEAIIKHVWGHEGGDHDMLRQLIHRLRSKLARVTLPQPAEESSTLQSPRIETIPGWDMAWS